MHAVHLNEGDVPCNAWCVPARHIHTDVVYTVGASLTAQRAQLESPQYLRQQETDPQIEGLRVLDLIEAYEAPPVQARYLRHGGILTPTALQVRRVTYQLHYTGDGSGRGTGPLSSPASGDERNVTPSG